MIIAGIVGFAVGAVLVLVLLLARRSGGAQPGPRATHAGAPVPAPADPVLDLLPTAIVLVDGDGTASSVNAAALGMRLVRGSVVAVPELDALVRAARRLSTVQQRDVTITLDGFPHRMLAVSARAEPLPGGTVALVVEDVTEAHRVESVRRDFVANVGHEIKTPVGALAILTEAALEAQDDPEAVRRFLGRLQHEAHRLSRLVQELLDLSRLQGGEPLPEATVVSLDAVVEEAVDRARPAAEAKRISLVTGGEPGVLVSGSERQLATAIANLLDNAVAYSPEGTRVAVGVRRREGTVEISVTDEGIGIAEGDLERIFERFYRADPARSRATGGTGLGLSIVKHIVGNHGGDVTAWSRPGEGSTFTVRLPPARPVAEPALEEVDHR